MAKINLGIVTTKKSKNKWNKQISRLGAQENNIIAISNKTKQVSRWAIHSSNKMFKHVNDVVTHPSMQGYVLQKLLVSAIDANSIFFPLSLEKASDTSASKKLFKHKKTAVLARHILSANNRA